MPRNLSENAIYLRDTIKPAIKSAIEAQGVTVPASDSFLDYADRIAEIEGGGGGTTKYIEFIQMFTDNNTTTSTYTINLEPGYYLISCIISSPDVYSISISGNNTELYSYQNEHIYRITEASTVTITYEPWSEFPSVDKLVCIFKIDGYTEFSAFYQADQYDGGVTYDLTNLDEGDYIIIAQGNSVYTGRARVDYPYSNIDGHGIQYLGDKDIRYWKTPSSYKALRVILYRAKSGQYRSTIYAYGQAAGFGVIQAIKVS